MDSMNFISQETTTKLFSLNVVLLSVGVYILSLTIKRCAGKRSEASLFKRLFPMVPVVLGVLISFIPGVFPSDSIGIKILNGLLASFLASYLHVFIKKTALGQVNLPRIASEEKPESIEEKKPEELE